MCNRCTEFDVTHAFATNNRTCDLDAALVADDALIANTFVFATVALVVLFRTEDLFVEEAVLFRTLGAVVDGFRLGYFARRPSENLLWRSERKAQSVPGVASRKFSGGE